MHRSVFSSASRVALGAAVIVGCGFVTTTADASHPPTPGASGVFVLTATYHAQKVAVARWNPTKHVLCVTDRTGEGNSATAEIYHGANKEQDKKVQTIGQQPGHLYWTCSHIKIKSGIIAKLSLYYYEGLYRRATVTEDVGT